MFLETAACAPELHSHRDPHHTHPWVGTNVTPIYLGARLVDAYTYVEFLSRFFFVFLFLRSFFLFYGQFDSPRLGARDFWPFFLRQFNSDGLDYTK